MNDIRQAMADDLQGTGLTGELTGVPVMQLEIRHARARPNFCTTPWALRSGCLIAALFFRRLTLMLVAAGPPLLGDRLRAWRARMAPGFLGLNMFLNVMTPLIMVISFSDSMQLTFAARNQLMAGRDKHTAFRNALLIAGPACMLTHAAAGLSLLGLLASSSDLIRGFGEAGFFATAIALVTVLSLVPTFGVLLIRDKARLAATLKAADPGVTALRRFYDWIARRMVSHPALFRLVDLVAVAGLAVVYSSLTPSYRLADEVPDRAVAASGRLDAEISGSNPIQVMITFPPGMTLYTPQTLATIADVQRTLESQPGVGNVWSLESLRRWLAEQMSVTSVDALRQFVDELPVFLVRRFIAKDENSVIVFGLVPDRSLTRLAPIVAQIERRLNAARKADPGYGIVVTGLSVIAARNSADKLKGDPMSERSDFYVYALYAPGDRLLEHLRYVGKGCGRRAIQSSAGRRSKRVLEWIAEVGEPLFDLLAANLTEAEAFALEIELIAKYGRECDGGVF